MTRTKTFSFTAWYFKPSGKFYTSADFNLTVQSIDTGGGEIPYMQDAVDYFKERRGPFPGLQSGRWDGPIVVNCEDGFPCLIPGRDDE
jgi:hypothetical protein